jgi:hypothetical protein
VGTCFGWAMSSWRRLSRFLPTDTRGKEHVDDRRQISGIIHVLRSGGRWIGVPPDCRPRKTLLQSLGAVGGQGRVGSSVRNIGAVRRPRAAVDDRLLSRESPPLGGGTKGAALVSKDGPGFRLT